MERIKLSLVRTDGGTQSREKLLQDLVKQYSQNMKDGDIFPPITLFHDGSDYWLADGFHRLFATKANGGLEIDAEIKQGTARDAKLHSLACNNRHGKPPTKAEIKAGIIVMLKDDEWSQWGLRRIAKHFSTSHTTVARIKDELDGKTNPSRAKTHVEKYEPADPKGIEGTKTEPPKKDDGQPPAIDPLQIKINDLTYAIEILEAENAMLKDKIAIGQWDASEIEKIVIEDTVKELREKIVVLEKENFNLRDSRDMFQDRNAELMRQVKTLQAKLKKAGM